MQLRVSQSFLRRHAVKLVASALITVGVLYTAHTGGLKIIPEGHDFSHVRWLTAVAYVPTVLGLMWFRSVRGRFLFRAIVEIPKTRLLAVTCAGYLAILLLPFRIGELARPYMLREKGKLTMTSATSAVVAERVIDGLFLSIVLAVILIAVPTVHPLPDHVVGLNISVARVRQLGFLMLGIFTTGFIVIMAFYFMRSFAERATRAVFGLVSPRLADKLAATATKLADGLHVFRSTREFFGFLGETAAYWGCNAFGMWILALGCGITHGDGSSITFLEACALMGMLGCTILIPGPPGLLGVFQAGIYAGMTMYFPADIVIGPGAAYIFLLYAIQVILTIVLGVWGIWYEGGTKRLRGAFADGGGSLVDA